MFDKKKQFDPLIIRNLSLNESDDTLLLVVCSCLLSLTGLAGAHGMLSIQMSQLRALRKALKGY